jgi:hypothetical protein
MNYDSIKFGKGLKRNSKCHVFVGNAYCDSNLKEIYEIDSLLNGDLCSNCLTKVCNTYGPLVAANIELRFYFNQYVGGSEFLDSIKFYINSSKHLTPKQLKTSISIFRDGNFRNAFNDDVTKLYRH